MTDLPSIEEAPIRLGVSSCLLGREVRFDGGHKHDRFLTGMLGAFVEWVPVCPEVEAGLGTPRPAMRLVRGDLGNRLVETASGVDHTRAMERLTRQRVRALREFDLCGYVLKRDSPSCGMTRVKVYGEKGMPRRDGRGLFAGALMDAYPNLPVEEEGRLNDSALRENFIERVFAYRRLSDLFTGRWTNGRVVAFHTAHKLQIMAHSPSAYRELGRLVGNMKGTPRAEFRTTYETLFMGALSKLASRGRNTNVLQHAAGYFSKEIDAASRAELVTIIRDYQNGLVPLVVPLTLIAHYVRAHEIEYLQGQVFLEPHPKELMLRNHV